jgi:hypothetical protein
MTIRAGVLQNGSHSPVAQGPPQNEGCFVKRREFITLLGGVARHRAQLIRQPTWSGMVFRVSSPSARRSHT